jgi:hypothetical protein
MALALETFNAEIWGRPWLNAINLFVQLCGKAAQTNSKGHVMHLGLMLFALLPIAALIGGIRLILWLDTRDRRRSPLSTQGWNQAGDGLRAALDKSNEDLLEPVMIVTLLGPFALIVWLIPRLDPLRLHLRWTDSWIAAALAISLAWAIVKLHRLVKERRKLRDGLAAELMIAQYLQPLHAYGCVVFHDIPAERFNLDHVVISRHAVFLIETKSRRKPAERGLASAKVFYDGTSLRFPTHTETAPLDQVRSEARWLAKFLAGAAGEAVKVVPVVALPGWWVEKESTGRTSDVVVDNLKNPKFLSSASFGKSMPDSLLARITHAVTSRYLRAEL